MAMTTGRSSSSVIGGAGAVVLSILGLAGIHPEYMAPISVIGIGAMLLLKGGAVAAEYSHVLAHLDAGRADKTELAGGLSGEIIAGTAGVVLGILALLGIAPGVLIACSVLAFGASLTMGGAAIRELNELKMNDAGVSPQAQHVASAAVNASIGAQVLVGIGAITLGILALVNIAPRTLDLVALLAIGGVGILTGAALGGRIASMFGH